ncbi:MAG: AMP-binding protein, partial [Acidimicrobiia bacterium]
MQLGAVARFWARWQPDGAAIRFEGRDLTWAELDRRTDTLAGGLGKLGLGPGDRLGILGQNSPRWCELVIAAFKAGAVAVPVNPRMAPTEVTEIVAHAGCRVLAADGGFASCLDAVAGRLPDVAFVAIDGDTGRGTPIDEVAAGPPLAWEPSAAEDSEPALIAYTSGTTGAPKGVVLTHTNLWAHVVLRAFSDRWTSSVRTLLAVPLAFTGGIVNNFVATYGVGGTLVLERAFEPARALRLLVDERITTLIGVPVMWQGIAAAPGFADADLSALSTAITGGAPVPETLLRTFHAKGVLIRQAYALTEAGALACQTPEHLALDRPESAGLPNLGTEIRIAGDDDRPLPAGEVGEIQLRGPQVTTGYWNDPAATAEGLAGGWLHT